MTSRAMPSHNGPPPKALASSESPNECLYLTNLPDKLQKPDLRMSLYTLFSTYGPVLDVVALKTKKMRGQAHIVFRDVQTSTQAMRALQGFDFFGKEMKIQYGKGRSNVFTRLKGVYQPPNVAPSTATELQQSIFNAPLPSTTVGTTAPTTSKPAEPASNGDKAAEEALQGVKRRREDESDEEEAPMDEDDDDVSMEASSDED